MIYDVSNDGYSISSTDNAVGMIINGGKNHKIFYNSVNMYGTFARTSYASPISWAIGTTTAVDGLDIRNNCFANSMTSTSGKSYAIAFYVKPTNFTINYNNYFVSGTNGVLGYSSSDVTTLTSWQGVTLQDGSSINSNPLFNSNTLLAPQAGSPALWIWRCKRSCKR